MLMRILTVAAVAAGGAMIAKRWNKASGSEGETRVEESIEINLPVRSVYHQWTQFEDFPQFMESVHEVRQLDDKRLHWRADVFGRTVEWDADITRQKPDREIAWRSTSGPPNGGTVRFYPLSENRTRVSLELYYAPQGTLESVGDTFGAVRLQARGNLERFKSTLEKRGQESGAWRGTIAGQPDAQQAH